MADEHDNDNPEEIYHPHIHEEGKFLKWNDDSDHDVNETGHYELMAEAIRELLIEKEIVTADDIRANIEFMDSRGPHLGAKIVAKAWNDPEYKKRLMEDGSAAVGEL
ncbi:MAG: nitrile hydratase subunit alpha, partial [Rhodospirillales bacterium]|nr:nitrile hydratase subunit alpha [Rhodospirillales bacterium]